LPYTYTLTTTLPASAHEIYEAWLDSLAHSEMTGAEASTSEDIDAEVSAWDGYITGRNLELVRAERIVQTWRTTQFGDEHEDSIITLTLESAEGGTLLTLVHSNVPDDQTGYEQGGWQEYYFDPMHEYFSKRERRAAEEHREPSRPAAPAEPAAPRPRRPRKAAAKKAEPAPPPPEVAMPEPEVPPAKIATGKKAAGTKKAAGKKAAAPKKAAGTKKAAATKKAVGAKKAASAKKAAGTKKAAGSKKAAGKKAASKKAAGAKKSKRAAAPKAAAKRAKKTKKTAPKAASGKRRR
jgi:uncharacterized protein YndB with AHSA1/START domain